MRLRFLLVPCVLAGMPVAASAGDVATPTASPARQAPSRRADLNTLSVTIAGPTSITNYWECTWHAYVSGGTPPYTYHWSATGLTPTGPDDADDWTGYKAVSGYGGLDVFVLDANGNRATTSLFIEDSGSISNCSP